MKSVCTSDIPYVQFEAIVHERFNVEALGRHNVRYVLIGELMRCRTMTHNGEIVLCKLRSFESS